MSVIKCYSVGLGDMYYIAHGTDNFTIIDCKVSSSYSPIIEEIKELVDSKGITRFISTHPDQDHFGGLEYLDDATKITNFYCVNNKAWKDQITASFTRYCELRDSEKAFYIEKNCSRKWMNKADEERGSSGINVLWPNTKNVNFKEALKIAEGGGSPNNISPIISYSLEDGVKALWMGDLETDFMEAVEVELNLPQVDILFAPHHGRKSARIPDSLLQKMLPKLIVVGEAPSEDLYYYPDHNTITQNSTGDIIFDCVDGEVHVFTSKNYTAEFLTNRVKTHKNYYYIGSIIL